MQKEALVCRSGVDAAWRFLCDEGPYLDGTDLAPPPLAFFAAGMAAHNAGLIVDEASRSHKELGDWSLGQDTFYTMEGSALRGTMTGGALPVEIELTSEEANSEACRDIVAGALRRSLAETLMATAFSGDFTITHNGEAIEAGRVGPAADSSPWFDAVLFPGVPPDPESDADRAIISKLKTVETSSDPTHGKGASLKEFQKRVLHLHTALAPRPDGRLESTVQLLRPLGSTFRFLASPTQSGKSSPEAPGGLDYLAAGIALCFLTQMGRYAKIIKGDLGGYGVIQDLRVRPAAAAIEGLDTHAWVQSGEDADTVRRYVDMSEQTCFLHASCRSANPSQISNGRNT